MHSLLEIYPLLHDLIITWGICMHAQLLRLELGALDPSYHVDVTLSHKVSTSRLSMHGFLGCNIQQSLPLLICMPCTYIQRYAHTSHIQSTESYTQQQ